MSDKPLQRAWFGIGEPPRPGMPWRVRVKLTDTAGDSVTLMVFEGTRAECEAHLAECRADFLATLERLQAAGLLNRPLSTYLTDLH